MTGPRRPGFLSGGASKVPMEMARAASPSAQPCLLPRLLQALGTRAPPSSMACLPTSTVARFPGNSGSPPLPSSSPISPSALWPCSLHVDTSSLGGAFNPQVLALLYLIASCLSICRAPQVALVVKNPPANAGDIKDASEFNPWVH